MINRKSQAINRRVLGLAAVQPGEQGIELARGPGVSPELLSQPAREGRGVGIDAWPSMAASAGRRNEKGARMGRAGVVCQAVADASFEDIESVETLRGSGDHRCALATSAG